MTAPVRRLGDTTWPELAATSPQTLLAIPFGSTEQHGPHLPFDTDTRIAIAIAEGLAERRRDVVVAPPVSYGSSGEHAAFAGTLSLGQAALEHLAVELCRSADAFAGVVLVCGHGGNVEALQRAAGVVRAEGRHVLVWFPSVPGGDAHAGATETSLLLALAPEAVHVDRAEQGTTTPLVELMPRLREQGVRAVSPNGVLGDPRRASAAAGKQLLAGLVDNLYNAVARWLADRHDAERA